jgi:hypothetical protein
MKHETINCLQRLKSSLEAAAQISNPGKVESVEALRSGIQIAVDAVAREIKYLEAKQAAHQ